MEDTLSKVIEYSVRPVTRYVVSRFWAESNGKSGGCGSSSFGELYNKDQAIQVALAMAASEEGAVSLGYMDRTSEAENSLGCCGAPNKP
jgi:hypothetical protein